MNDDEALAAIRWLDSIDFSSADAATCERALVVIDELRDRFDEAFGELLVRSKPPVGSIHRHTPLRRMGS